LLCVRGGGRVGEVFLPFRSRHMVIILVKFKLLNFIY
jgi:hypothetical protein